VTIVTALRIRAAALRKLAVVLRSVVIVGPPAAGMDRPLSSTPPTHESVEIWIVCEPGNVRLSRAS
jgi:hypothetical protein